MRFDAIFIGMVQGFAQIQLGTHIGTHANTKLLRECTTAMETNHPYGKLLKPFSFRFKESTPLPPKTTITERHLQAIWFEQKFFTNLVTTNGERIEVISPGIWNSDAGPDFIKTHLKIGEKEIRGDVEIHLNDSSWQTHKHHLDEKYNRVILHIALKKPIRPQEILNLENQKIPQSYFEPFLTVPISNLKSLVDLDLYPYKKFANAGRCSQAIFSKSSDASIIQFFQNASDWRLAEKQTLLESFSNQPHEQLLYGISMALGYKANAIHFGQLYKALLALKPVSEERCLATALKACGFFGEKYQQRWGACPFYQSLQALPTPQFPLSIKLELHQIRPLNHPLRRLVAMVKMICDQNSLSLFKNLNFFWETHWHDVVKDPKNCAKLFKQMMEMIPSYTDPFWNSHYTFNGKRQDSHLPLIGNDLKREIFVNTYFPLLREFICTKERKEEFHAFHVLYHSIPASKNSKAKYLIQRFFEDKKRGTQLLKRIGVEQGAFQVHKDFCLHYEASCDGCDFIERFHHYQMDEMD